MPADSCLMLETAAPLRLERFLARQPESALILALEEKLNVDLNLNGRNYAFTGTLDRLDRRGGLLYVLDYKTGTIKRHDGSLWTDELFFRRLSRACAEAGADGRVDAEVPLDSLFENCASVCQSATALLSPCSGPERWKSRRRRLVELKEDRTEMPLFGGLGGRPGGGPELLRSPAWPGLSSGKRPAVRGQSRQALRLVPLCRIMRVLRHGHEKNAHIPDLLPAPSFRSSMAGLRLFHRPGTIKKMIFSPKLCSLIRLLRNAPASPAEQIAFIIVLSPPSPDWVRGWELANQDIERRLSLGADIRGDAACPAIAAYAGYKADRFFRSPAWKRLRLFQPESWCLCRILGYLIFFKRIYGRKSR